MSKKKQRVVVLKKIGRLLYDYLIPKQIIGTADALNKEQLNAISQRKTVSQLLFYRTYEEEDTGASSPMGIYTMADGREGVVFEVTPPAYLSENIENKIISMLSAIVKDETVVTINTFASSNIKEYLDSFRESHSLKRKTNLENPDVIQDYVDNKLHNFNEWRTKSILGRDADFRIRNFRHTISILFPYDCERNIIREQYYQILGMLNEISGKNMPASSLIPLLKEFVNPELDEYSQSNDTVTKINTQITKGARIRVDDESGILHFGKNEKWIGKVLTTDKFPPEMDLFTYQNAFFDAMGNDNQMHIPSPFMLSLTIKFTDVEKKRKSALSKARHNYKHTSALGYRMEKIFPEIKALKNESESVIENIDTHGEIPVEGKWDLFICDSNLDNLNRSVGAIKNSFESLPGRWLLKEESFSMIAYHIFLQSFPLNYMERIQDNIKKMDMLFKSNNAQIAPLISDFKGLGTVPTHFYIGRTGQLLSVDFFASLQNYNVVVIGPQGSGKSMFTNDFCANGLAAGWDIRLVDFGRSYLGFCNLVGGQFLEFQSNNEKCLNFFTHMNTKIIYNENEKEEEVIHEDEYDTTVPVIGLMMGVSLKNIYKLEETSNMEKLKLTNMSRYVIKALDYAWSIKGRNAGMREVSEGLQKFRDDMKEKDNEGDNEAYSLLSQMIVGLENYSSPRGPYYKYYNGTNNINIKSKFLITELDDISDSAVMPVIAMGILQRMAQEAFIEYGKDKNTSRVIGVDEAWKVIDSEIFVNFLEDFARRIRKYNGITILVSQRIADFFGNSAAATIFETASYKIFLPNEKSAIDSAISKKYLSMNSFQSNLMKSVISKKPHYNEILFNYGNAQFVALLKLTADDYWTFTSDPKDRATIANVINSRGYSSTDAIWYLARKTEKMKEEEILYKMEQRKNRTNRKINWDEFFNNTIYNDSIKVVKQYIYDISDEVPTIIGKELLMRIENEGIMYPNSFFKSAAKEKNVYLDLTKRFIEKCFFFIKTLEGKTEKVSINLDIEEIKNQKFKDFLFESIATLGNCKSKLIFDFILDYETKENIEILLSFSNELKELGIGIAFDNIDFSQLDVRTLIETKPTQYKINIEDIKEILKDKMNLTYAKNLLYSLISNNKESGALTIFVKVETEEDLELAKEFNVNYVQGFMYGQPQFID